MTKRDRLHLCRQGLLISAGLVLMLCYQNCSSNMQGMQESASTSMSAAAMLEQKAMAVLTTRCLSCHNSDLRSGGVSVTDINSMLYYREIVPGEPQLSILYNKIQDGSMPPAPNKPLTAAEARAISDWITDGFKDGTPTTTPPPPNNSLQPTYASIYKYVIQSSCNGCHAGPSALGGVRLDSYSAVMNQVVAGNPNASALYTAVAVRNTMPKSGGALTAAEKTAIQTWIMNGAANN